MSLRRARRGFSLLEVMIALAILTVSLVLLVETQSAAVLLTTEAEKIVVATDLAKVKLAEALLDVERNGMQVTDHYESGDFSELGSDLLDAEFGPEIEAYQWEYVVSEVDIEMLGDLAGAAESLPGAGGDDAAGGGGPAGGALAGLSALGIGPDMITSFLAPYVREVRVRVWWGDSSTQAEEDGTEVVIVTHVISPSGPLQLQNQVPQ